MNERVSLLLTVMPGTCPEQGDRDEAQRKLYKDGIIACARQPNMVAKISGA